MLRLSVGGDVGARRRRRGVPVPRRAVARSVQGSLTVDWSIHGTRDPSPCSQGAAAAIEITVTDTNLTATRRKARLIDAVGTPRTTTVSIDALTIFGNDDFDAPIDFAATSFF